MEYIRAGPKKLLWTLYAVEYGGLVILATHQLNFEEDDNFLQKKILRDE